MRFPNNKSLWPGFSTVPLTDKIRKEIKVPDSIKGVVVGNVDNGTPAQIGGFSTQDVITKINQKPVTNLMEFYAALND